MMAKRRMFSKEVIGTDWFTDMPATSQLLYIHLSMEADDDGFVTSSKSAMLNAHATKDDLAILTAKRYVIPLDSGLYLIKHWKQNNYLRNDRYKPSDYADRLADFDQKPDGSYTLKDGLVYQMDTSGIPSIELGKSKSKARIELGKGTTESPSLHSVDSSVPAGNADARDGGDLDEPF